MKLPTTKTMLHTSSIWYRRDSTSLVWKTLVENSIKLKNKNDILEQIKTLYKKILFIDLVGEKCELKEYIKNQDLSSARDMFRLRSRMTTTVKMNYPSDKKYKSDLWRCKNYHCLDTQTRIMTYPEYLHLDNDKDLISYLRKVLNMRDGMIDD